ncbi:hypothetical protein SAMN05216375_104112 [Trichococcus ilyis]|uniref:Uncharacterized protein n=1 Tax=Trichococcus ilyis TaxID=640938 RepID=A0A143YEP2_9LACT|nr:Hypothetical protein TR210_745 [Trichococcus ilyis]SEI86687.1 hypothetical protein SAMN05216375_104112 [Trichococcus ilyis]
MKRQPLAFGCRYGAFVSGVHLLSGEGGLAGVAINFAAPAPASVSPPEVTMLSRHQLRRAFPHRSWC